MSSLPGVGACLVFVVFAGFLPADEPAKESGEEAKKVLEGHSYHGEAFNEGPRQKAYLMAGTGPMTGTGRVQFPVTTKDPMVQKLIEQGVGQLHGFWYFEAERSFRQAAALEPSCAMAYWGMAQANVENEKRAKGFIEESIERKDGITEREVLYIDSFKRFLDAGRKKRKERASRYVKDLEKIIYENPDDVEAKAFLVVQMWKNNRAGVPINSHVAVNALLGQIFEAEPMHPAHHYRIHLWDYERPEVALRSAVRCGQSAPSIAHMWHMPGHIFSRLKRYNDAAWQQEASARVDHAHMMRDRVLPDQIHNFAHNNEWLIRNLMFVGRVTDALDLAKNMIELPRHPKYNHLDRGGCSTSYGRRRLFEVLSRYELWEETIALAHTPYLEPTHKEEEQVKRLRALAVAYVRKGDIEKGIEQLFEIESRQRKLEEARDAAGKDASEREREKIEEGKIASVLEPSDTTLVAFVVENEEKKDDQKKKEDEKRRKAEEEEKKRVDKARNDARKPFDRRINRLEKAAQEVRGHLAVEAGKLADGVELLRKAGGVDTLYLARLEVLLHDEEVREAAKNPKKEEEKKDEAEKDGDEKKEKKPEKTRREKALEDARKHVERKPGEVKPLAGLVEVFWAAREKKEAAIAFEDLRQNSSVIDLEIGSPVFERLAAIAAELGLEKDWRIRKPTPDDVGDRPNLDTLGPFRWQPTASPDWTLVDFNGKSRSLADYRGKPVVVIFYLGYGCLHCVEQLHAFAPRADEFREAGIEMLAIGNDKKEDLTKAVENFSEFGFAFPLLADPKMDIFKAYRAYDDFEDQPLHGTFVIDGKGRILWQDVSYEPFMDPQFVFDEAHRLLGRPVPLRQRRL